RRLRYINSYCWIYIEKRFPLVSDFVSNRRSKLNLRNHVHIWLGKINLNMMMEIWFSRKVVILFLVFKTNFAHKRDTPCRLHQLSNEKNKL
uniref:Uncharacterized protein n=1 Tax=Aegilops tauschii subsp. strangulata TaxID=200361 RepID=A0A453JYJ5_AEGTS